MKKFIIVLWMLTSFAVAAYAEDKSWNAEGDGADWADDANWMPAGQPTVEDDTKVDMKDAAAEIGQSFEVKSLTIGGKKASTVDISNFVTGTIDPASDTAEGITARRDGKLIIKGSAGKITLRGTYKDSEEIIPDEPSFMLYVK